jgi:small subunit ribosomal protein S9
MEKTKAIGKYVEGIGRRKTAIARVRLVKGTDHKVTVNEKPFEKFFQVERLRRDVLSPITALKLDQNFAIHAHVNGGGVKAQAEAIRHGLARALVKTDEDLKKLLRGAGYLTRDPRMVERKKPGLKKARRAPQWAKR